MSHFKVFKKKWSYLREAAINFKSGVANFDLGVFTAQTLGKRSFN